MIEYNVQYGKRAGIHYIFESSSEATEYLTLHPELNTINQDITSFRLWRDDTIKEGEWIRTDDGKILQTWKVYNLPAKYSNIRKTFQVKVCCGCFYFYVKADGSISGKRMAINNAILSNPAKMKGSMGEQRLLGKYKSLRKKMFAYYVSVYSNPHIALILIQKNTYGKNSDFPEEYYYSFKFIVSAFELLKDPYVQEEIKRYMPTDTFKDRMKKALSEQEIDEAYLAMNIREGLNANISNPKRIGGLNHKEFIKLGLQALEFVNTDNKALDSENKQYLHSDKKDTIETTSSELNLLPEPPKDIADSVIDSVKEDVKKKNQELLDKMVSDDIDSLLKEFKESKSIKNNDKDNDEK